MLRAPHLLALVLASFSAPIALGAQAEAHQEAATAVAVQWLTLLDQEKYEQSWKEAGALFQDAVSVQQWETMARQARGPMGALVSREPLRAVYSASVPNAPPGEYVIVDFTSAFENLPNAVERVVTIRDGGEWRVVGSFVLPPGS